MSTLVRKGSSNCLHNSSPVGAREEMCKVKAEPEPKGVHQGLNKRNRDWSFRRFELAHGTQALPCIAWSPRKLTARLGWLTRTSQLHAKWTERRSQVTIQLIAASSHDSRTHVDEAARIA